jgi:hypothetical protein
MAVQMLLGTVLVNALHAAFEDTVEALKIVGVHVTTDVSNRLARTTSSAAPLHILTP